MIGFSFLKKLDLFPYKMQLYLRGKDGKSSRFGGLMSTFLLLLVIILLFISVKNGLFSVKSSTNTKLEFEDSGIQFRKNDVIAIIVDKDNQFIQDTQKRIFDFDINYIHKYFDEETGTRQQNYDYLSLNLVPCSKEYLISPEVSREGISFVESISNIESQRCLNFSKLTVRGVYENLIFQYFKVSLMPCQNSPDCATQEEIQQHFLAKGKIYFRVMFPKYKFTGKIENVYEKSYSSLQFIVDYEKFLQYDVYLTKQVANVNNNPYLYDRRESIIRYSFKFGQKDSFQSLKTVDQDFISVYLREDENQDVHILEVCMITSFVSFASACFSAFQIIGFIIISSYNKQIHLQSITQKIYDCRRIIKKDQKTILEKHTKQYSPFVYFGSFFSKQKLKEYRLFQFFLDQGRSELEITRICTYQNQIKNIEDVIFTQIQKQTIESLYQRQLYIDGISMTVQEKNDEKKQRKSTLLQSFALSNSLTNQQNHQIDQLQIIEENKTYLILENFDSDYQQFIQENILKLVNLQLQTIKKNRQDDRDRKISDQHLDKNFEDDIIENKQSDPEKQQTLTNDDNSKKLKKIEKTIFELKQNTNKNKSGRTILPALDLSDHSSDLEEQKKIKQINRQMKLIKNQGTYQYEQGYHSHRQEKNCWN